MDNILMAQAIWALVEKQIDKNKDNIRLELTKNCEAADSRDQIYVKMLINTMKISTYISVKIILDMLLEQKLVRLADEKEIRKAIMSIIK